MPFVDRDLHTLNRDHGLGDNTIHSITHDADGFIWFGASGSLSRYDGQNVKVYDNGQDGNAKTLNITSLHAIGSTPYLIYNNGGNLGWFNRHTGRFLTGVHFPEDNSVSDVFEFDSCGIGIVTQSHILVIDTRSLNEHDGRLNFRIKRNLKMNGLSSTRLQKASASGDTIAVMDGKCNAYFFRANSPGKAIKRAMMRDNYMSLNSVLLDGDCLLASTMGSGIIYHHIPSGKTVSLNHDSPSETGGKLSHSDVYSIVKTAPDEYTAVTWSGYSVINTDMNKPGKITSTIYNFTTQQAMRNVENRMICAHRDGNGILWLGTSGGGVLWTDIDNRYYGKYYQDRHNAIMSITVDRAGYVWLATFHKGILRSKQTLAESRTPDFVETTYPGKSATRAMLSSMEDNEGRLWFGNSKGDLTVREAASEKWSVVSLPKEVEINALVQVTTGNIFAGTSAGLYEVTANGLTARKIILKENSEEPLPDMDIRSLIACENGDLWIGTTVHGLLRLKNNGMLESGYEQSKGIAAFDLRTMVTQGDSIIWAGYRSGLAKFDVRGDSISEFLTTHNGLCSNIIGAL